MKKKLTLITSLALVGVVGVGYAAWNFGSSSTASTTAGVDIAPMVSTFGTLALTKPANFDLDDHPTDLLPNITIAYTWTVNAQGLTDLGKTGADLQLTATATLSAGLGTYIVVAAPAAITDPAATGGTLVFTVAWQSGMNPTDETEYDDMVTALGTPLITINAQITLI